MVRKRNGAYVASPWRHAADPQPHRSDEVALYEALLLDCVESLARPERVYGCYGKVGSAQDIRWLRRRLREDIDWVCGRGNPLVSFERCCAILRLDADAVRGAMKKAGLLDLSRVEQRLLGGGQREGRVVRRVVRRSAGPREGWREEGGIRGMVSARAGADIDAASGWIAGGDLADLGGMATEGGCSQAERSEPGGALRAGI